MTHKLLKGPLIIKTDAGPGRLSREAQSITFREEMANKGVFILLSLPNGTACTAELDQMFTQFKDQTKNSTIRVAGLKLAARLAARMKHDGIDNELSSSDEDEDETENKPEKKRSICNVNISNRDLARIVNGFSNDPIELRPFDNCFTEAKIVKTWIAVGFLPMTGNAANDPKVGYELGEGGAPEEARVRMESLVDDYSEVAEMLTNSGFNGNILNLAPRQVSRETFPEDEEAQIEHIIKNKGMMKAGKLYKVG